MKIMIKSCRQMDFISSQSKISKQSELHEKIKTENRNQMSKSKGETHQRNQIDHDFLQTFSYVESRVVDNKARGRFQHCTSKKCGNTL